MSEDQTELPEGITQELVFRSSDGTPHDSLEGAVTHQGLIGVEAQIDVYLDGKWPDPEGEGPRKGKTRDRNQLVLWEIWKASQ